MEQLIITCQKNSEEYVDRKLAVYFYGWLVGKLDPEMIDRFHETGVNPLSIYVDEDRKNVRFHLGLLNDEVIEQVRLIFNDENMTTISLESSSQKSFEIIKKESRELTAKELSKRFYVDEAEGWHNVRIVTPMAFKSHGEYRFLPDVRLFLQSLMKKYTYLDEGTEKIDKDLLDELCRHVQISGFRIHSQRYFIHHAYVTGFCGNFILKCSGSQTLKNYLKILLAVGEFTGAGVKTSLGMGAIQLVKKEEKDGKAKG